MALKDYLPSFINFDKPQPKSANARATITFEQQLQRVRQDATKFKIAVQAAESPMYPNRFLLMQMYQNIVLDGQVQSAMMQRKMRVLSQKFNVKDSSGIVNEEKTKLLKQSWFYDFVELALDSMYWGFSAIQFSPVVDSKFINCELIPRIYVVPEFSLIRTNTATVTEGINFTKAPYSNWCLGVGKKRDLGMLMKLAPYVIWKNNAMGAWAEFAEIFGVPIRITKTDVRDEVTRKNAENMMKNMGVASWSVLDLNDNIELIEASRTDSFNVFDKMVERCNSEISKIILGQTGTTDEKAYSGSSNVHQEIANQIGQQDMLWMQFVVNGQLLPMMNNLGFGFDGLEFEFDTTESLPIAEQAKIDASFMPYVKFNKEYLEDKYNIILDDVEDLAVNTVQSKLKNLYS
jgi:phage gp29-like protein